MIKKNDFIELEYIAKITATNQIFDVTDEKIAHDMHVHTHANFGAVTICVGQHDLVPGLDNFLVGKEPGDYKVQLEPKDAFGIRDAKLMKIIPTNIFKKKEIIPYPGLQVNIDNLMGTIRSVSGGRTIVDFNHPLAGKAVTYEIKILKIIEKDEEKLKGFIKLHLNAEAELKEGIADIKMEIPATLHKPLADKIKELIPAIKEVKFKEAKNKK